MTDTVTTSSGLKRVLGRFDTLALGFGAIIGWSWIVLIAQLMGDAGSLGSVAATAAGGFVIIVVGLLYGELASAMPEVGGEHAYSLRALGRHASFVCTWAIALSYVAVVGFEAVALPAVMGEMISGLGNMPMYSVNGWIVSVDHAAIGSGAALLIGWINLRGIRVAAMVQMLVVLLILASGLMLFTGALAGGSAENTAPAFTGTAGVFAAMALVPFMMVGFDVIPQSAEEIDLPPRKIGLLIVGSLTVAVLWYILIELAVAYLLPAAERPAGSLATINAAGAAFGEPGRMMLLLGGFAGILTSWNAFLIGGSRAIFALAKHTMLPNWFAGADAARGTPKNAILFITAIAVVAPFLGRPSFVWFVNAGSFALIIAYVFVAWSFLVLRAREPGMERPFRVPAGRAFGVFGLVASLAMGLLYMPEMPAALVWQEWLMVGLWFSVGAVLYHTAQGQSVQPN